MFWFFFFPLSLPESLVSERFWCLGKVPRDWKIADMPGKDGDVGDTGGSPVPISFVELSWVLVLGFCEYEQPHTEVLRDEGRRRELCLCSWEKGMLRGREPHFSIPETEEMCLFYYFHYCYMKWFGIYLLHKYWGFFTVYILIFSLHCKLILKPKIL